MRPVPRCDSTLRDIFERYRSHPWLFVRPYGNWGDDFLFTGAERLADRVGVRWRSVDTESFATEKIDSSYCIYLQGNGGYNHWCSGTPFINLESAVARDVCAVVQGPVSAETGADWLAQRFQQALAHIRCSKLYFFARELTTLSTLLKLQLHERGVTICLDNDTALALSERDVLDIAQMSEHPRSRYNLIVARDDPEQPTTERDLGEYIRDDSYSTICLDPAYEARSLRHWVRIHLYANSIVTNRLHSSILGHIANKSVTLSSGSYHKNRSVWEYSLADRGVDWLDAFARPRTPFWSRLPNRVRQSYKVRKARLAAFGVPRD